jgi:AcrR family transcriptional regulator
LNNLINPHIFRRKQKLETRPMTDSALRKKPAQARSRARYEAILAAAKALIAEKGSDTVKMSEVAERAGVPIGSVYQFFPDKGAIIQTLAEDYMEQVRAGLREEVKSITDKESAGALIARLMDSYYAFFLMEPVARDIWCGTQADKRMQDIDIEDSRLNGEIFFAALKPLAPRAAWKGLKTDCFLMMQLTGAAVRLAVALDRKEGDRIIDAYKGMLLSKLMQNLGS